MKMTCWMTCLQPTWPNGSMNTPDCAELIKINISQNWWFIRLWALLQICRTEVFEDTYRNDVTVVWNTHVVTPTVSAAEFSSLNVQIYWVEFLWNSFQDSLTCRTLSFSFMWSNHPPGWKIEILTVLNQPQPPCSPTVPSPVRWRSWQDVQRLRDCQTNRVCNEETFTIHRVSVTGLGGGLGGFSDILY